MKITKGYQEYNFSCDDCRDDQWYYEILFGEMPYDSVRLCKICARKLMFELTDVVMKDNVRKSSLEVNGIKVDKNGKSL